MDWKRLQNAMRIDTPDDAEKALKEFQAMADETSDANERASLLLSKVPAYITLGNLVEAENALHNANKLRPSSADVQLNLRFQEACLLLLRDRAAEALVKFNRILKDFPVILNDPKQRFLYEDIIQRRAFALVNIGRLRDALPLLKEATAFTFNDPKDEQLVHLYIGTCHSELGQYELAKSEFLRLILSELSSPWTFEARYRLAAIYLREGALAQAKLRLEEVVSSFDTANEPNVPRENIYELLAETRRSLGENGTPKA